MLLTNLKINTVTKGVIDQGFIQIKGKKIITIGPMTTPLPEDDEIIAFEGQIALPGLIDAHTHIGMFGDGLGFEGDDGNESTDPITPHVRAVDSVNPMDRCFGEALEYGVTTVVVGPGSANPISGQLLAMKTSGRCIDKMLLSINAGTKFALGENPKMIYSQRNQGPITRMGTTALIREHLYKVKKYDQDCLNAQEDEDAEEPDADLKLSSLLPLVRGESQGYFHVHRADDIFTALRLAAEFDIHPVLVHATEAHLIAEELAEQQARVICGPLIGSRSKPELVHLNRKNPAILHKKGVKIAICTDHPEVPQEFLMLSAAIAHKEGLPSEEAIRAITINAAELCRLESCVGSLEVGKDADIVIYENDPLLGIEKPMAVFVDGVKRV